MRCASFPLRDFFSHSDWTPREDKNFDTFDDERRRWSLPDDAFHRCRVWGGSFSNKEYYSLAVVGLRRTFDLSLSLSLDRSKGEF